MDNTRDRMQLEGTVIDANKGLFKVRISENYTVLATLAGKIRVNSVRILVGDSVVVEVSEYRPDKGRIVYRNK